MRIQLPAVTIQADLTLNVPAQFADINAALVWLKSYSIADCTVTIKVNSASSSYSAPVNMTHPDGHNIQIIGNVADPTLCVLTFNDCDGFTAYAGANIGLLDGFKIMSNRWISHGVWTMPGTSGIRASNGGVIRCGSSVIVEKCYYGYHASQGGAIYCEAGVKANECGDGGFFAFMGGSIEISGVSYSENCKDAANNLGFGYIAEAGGTLRCDLGIGRYNHRAGFFANTNGSIWAHGATARFNGTGVLGAENGQGVLTGCGGVVEADGIVASDNYGEGVLADHKSIVRVPSSTINNNYRGAFARSLSYIDLRGTAVTNNNQEGALASVMGCINTQSATFSGNLVNKSPAAGTEGNQNSFMN